MKNSNFARFARALFFIFVHFVAVLVHTTICSCVDGVFSFFFNQSLNGSCQFNSTIASTHLQAKYGDALIQLSPYN